MSSSSRAAAGGGVVIAPDTPLDALEGTFRAARDCFREGHTRSYEWRMSQLKAMKAMFLENQDAINAALHADLHRPKFEAVVGETVSTVTEIDVIMDNLWEWMKPTKVATGLLQLPASSKILKDPKGVVLVLGAWNFPFMLTLLPVATAISAGNSVVVKPSEVSPICATVMAELVTRYMDPRAVRVVLGGVEQSTRLLDMPFNHIFYTGGTAVGSVVMAAAAKRLVPVTLELGGKSPAIVAKDANLAVAARRIVSGKFFNCGQVCLAPDYVLVDSTVETQLLAEISKAITAFYGTDPKASASLGRVVNRRHFDRLSGLMQSHRGEVVVGGDTDASQLYIAPTVFRNVAVDSPIMREEIFGPLLPVVVVSSVEKAIEFVNDRAQPLALYVFTNSSAVSDKVLAQTTSGGACVNDTIMHVSNPNLPFGGVGPSGLGAYHGKFGFDTFSHAKAVLSAPTWSDPALRYPPYSDKALNIVSWIALKAKFKFPFGKPGLAVAVALLAYSLSQYYKAKL